MKRAELIRHIESWGCVFDREGARHTLYRNPEKNKTSTVPRHKEINDDLAKKICRDLDVPKP